MYGKIRVQNLHSILKLNLQTIRLKMKLWQILKSSHNMYVTLPVRLIGATQEL